MIEISRFDHFDWLVFFWLSWCWALSRWIVVSYWFSSLAFEAFLVLDEILEIVYELGLKDFLLILLNVEFVEEFILYNISIFIRLYLFQVILPHIYLNLFCVSNKLYFLQKAQKIENRRNFDLLVFNWLC